MRRMSLGREITCGSCGAEVSREIPEYFVELECFRLMADRQEKMPRRGSNEYHKAMDTLLPEIREAYFNNSEMYDKGHLWCSSCGCRLGPNSPINGI